MTTNDSARTIGKHIGAWRRRASYTQEVLAEKANIASGYVAAVERGAKHPSLDVLDRIATALNLHTAQLLVSPGESIDGSDILTRVHEDVTLSPRTKILIEAAIRLDWDQPVLFSDVPPLESLTQRRGRRGKEQPKNNVPYQPLNLDLIAAAGGISEDDLRRLDESEGEDNDI